MKSRVLRCWHAYTCQRGPTWVNTGLRGHRRGRGNTPGRVDTCRGVLTPPGRVDTGRGGVDAVGGLTPVEGVLTPPRGLTRVKGVLAPRGVLTPVEGVLTPPGAERHGGFAPLWRGRARMGRVDGRGPPSPSRLPRSLGYCRAARTAADKIGFAGRGSRTPRWPASCRCRCHRLLVGRLLRLRLVLPVRRRCPRRLLRGERRSS